LALSIGVLPRRSFGVVDSRKHYLGLTNYPSESAIRQTLNDLSADPSGRA
jgi:hypothetical protein